MSEDYTAIKIHFDPHKNILSGWTNHKGLYFECPVISKVAHNLYQGGCQKDGLSKHDSVGGLLLPDNIKHVVNLFQWGGFKAKHELHSQIVVKMYDAETGPDKDQILALANWVNVCRKQAPTLVHCQAGLNRSALVVATALIIDPWCDMNAEEVIAMLRETRSEAVLCNQAFEDWLRTVPKKRKIK